MGAHVPPCSPAHLQAARALCEPKLLYFNGQIHFYLSNYTSTLEKGKYDVNSNLYGHPGQHHKDVCAELHLFIDLSIHEMSLSIFSTLSQCGSHSGLFKRSTLVVRHLSAQESNSQYISIIIC